MTDPNQLLADLTVWAKYARYLPAKQRRETWSEIIDRNVAMHVARWPQYSHAIDTAFEAVRKRRVLPSMRSLQFGGKPIELNETRGYNCSYVAVDDWRAYPEAMFLLIGGTGVGFSVQRHHVAKLPSLYAPRRARRFLVGDSLEGWADAVKQLVKAFFEGAAMPDYDFRDIRPAGAPLRTAGGKSPGAEPLISTLSAMRRLLERVGTGNKLQPIDAHDLMCHLAGAPFAGGIRSSALISLFSADDDAMLMAKTGTEWHKANPQRRFANNSAVIHREHAAANALFSRVWEHAAGSGSGEPGILWTNDYDQGTNPCAEISLQNRQFCNLCEINSSDVESQSDLEYRVQQATFIGTLQATYTNFHYIRPEWQDNCEAEALLGVSQTGVGSGRVLRLNLESAARHLLAVNADWASRFGIQPAARGATLKPAGTTSLVFGSSSGAGAWHARHYLRRIRLRKHEALYGFLMHECPSMVEDNIFSPKDQAVIAVPQRAPEGAIIRGEETTFDLLERVRRFNVEWIRPAHRSGPNPHNVSATISVKPDEWDAVGKWMWEHRADYNGLSVLPYDGGTYKQAPFEEIDASEYQRRLGQLHEIDFERLYETDDTTHLQAEAACSGGVCELKSF